MAHFVGRGGASHFLRTGEQPAATKPGNKGKNPTIEKYVADWKEKYESQLRAPSPEPSPTRGPSPAPTPTPRSLQETTTPTPSPSREPTPIPTPTPSMQLHETVAQNTQPIVEEDEPDNTLQRRLAKSDTPLQPPAGTPLYSGEDKKEDDEDTKRIKEDFAYVKKEQEHLQKMFKLAGVGADKEQQPREFVYQVGEDVIKSPQEWAGYVDKMTKEVYESNLSSEDRAQYLSALSSYEKSRERVAEAYNKAEERIDQARIFEILGHALAKLAAGWYGLKHGIDMSGVQFQLSDWSGDYKRIAKRLDREMDSIEGKEKITRAEFKEQERAAEKAAADEERRHTRAYYTEKSDFEARESKRVTAANRILREGRRDVANLYIERGRNLRRLEREAQSTDNKTRQGAINSLKLQESQLKAQISQAEKDKDNLNKAFKAKKMEDKEFYLRKVSDITREKIEDISGRGFWNLEDTDDILVLEDVKITALKDLYRQLSDIQGRIRTGYEGGDITQSASSIDAEIEAVEAEIKKKEQELGR